MISQRTLVGPPPIDWEAVERVYEQQIREFADAAKLQAEQSALCRIGRRNACKTPYAPSRGHSGTDAAMNPRFEIYCKSSGITVAHGRAEVWKFTVWMREQWQLWRVSRNISNRWYMVSTADHADFDEWLGKRFNSH